jgi:squalene-hopene/tetraprenyl-beta-curcumene cyclase
VEPALTTKVGQAVERAQRHLLGLQKPDGHWIGELWVDTTVACDYMFYMYWRGQVDFNIQSRIAKNLLDRQQPDGGWNQYTGGPSEINCTVKCYLALKLAGFSGDEPVMKKAHSVILRLGGIPKTNTYCKLYLALLGLFPWRHVPVIPAEAILLPNWFPFNIYELSSWTRGMFVPLAIINHFKPTRHLPPEKQIHELFPYGTEGQDFSLPRSPEWFSGRNFFLMVNDFLWLLEELPFKPLRGRALKACEAWMLERIGEGCDGLGAIFPSILQSIIALKCLGYPDDHPLLLKQEKDFHDFHVVDEARDDYRIQPCLSPVWDTAITSVALTTSGIPADHPAMVKAADWLLEREVKIKGDWSVVKNKYPHAGGWAFEYHNDYYPDADDTFKVLLALRRIRGSDPEKQKTIMARALEWARSFQCQDGGYAAFDKDVNKQWLNHVPFADHNAILDPSCSDITARGLECMGRMGVSRGDKVVRRAIGFLRTTQEEDGSWWGRWGVNYIYGTWQALRGLQAIGEDMNQDWIVRAREWLESCQNPDGGWGETPASYDDPRLKGRGPSTPSQTAWGLMGMLTSGDPLRTSVRKAVDCLASTQQPDGQWTEDEITGTGFPKVFYLKYDFYRNNWPLLAMSEWRDLLEGRAAAAV